MEDLKKQASADVHDNNDRSFSPVVHKSSGDDGIMLIPRPSDDPRDPLVCLSPTRLCWR